MLVSSNQRIQGAYWTEASEGLVLLAEDWHRADEDPPLELASDTHTLSALRPAEVEQFAELSGYCIEEGRVSFILLCEHYPHLNFHELGLYVAGAFNGWGQAIGNPEWELRAGYCRGKDCFRLTVPLERCQHGSEGKPMLFKFVTRDEHWLVIRPMAPNARMDEHGNGNYELCAGQGGRHCFLFHVGDARAITGKHHLCWEGEGSEGQVPILPGTFFYDLGTDLPLGAEVRKNRTYFRLFAPRATEVLLELFEDLDEKKPKTHRMKLADEHTWEISVPGNKHGWYYFFRVDGVKGKSTGFDVERRILDPWALACVSEVGPGIVIDQVRLPSPPKKPYEPPQWQDLVILEGHVRDLACHAQVEMPAEDRLGFAGLTRWVQEEGSYLRELGVSALELQPIQQFDSPSKEDYHWGYMTTNYFAPCAWYGRKPEEASQLEEFRELVDACHEAELAVILDVVYNHVGEPPFLLFIDKEYYFDIEADGKLVNWSGCGNTLRADARMAKRLILESLTHLVRHYDVDGFRFDLAELIGLEVLVEIERELKKIKPGIILIAEPWSFRGHIARDLRHTGFAFWNDGYRDFLVDYVKGKGNYDGMNYFLEGSLAHLAAFPAQSVNYVESHDDYCWMDRITTNGNKDGSHPTELDRSRTHIMLALLMSSVGIPMLSAGQDMLRSKRGNHNTYLRGDINALDYNRRHDQAATHHYFREWIRFRLSDAGQAWRLWERPSEGYFRSFGVDGHSSIAHLANSDYSRDCPRLLTAVNPHSKPVTIYLYDLHVHGWTQLADTHTFHREGIHTDMWVDHQLHLPPHSCGLWLEKKR